MRTTRFGVVSIYEDRILTFEKGLLGFSEQKRFTLLEPGEDAAFFWLQSIDEPSLAFVVTDPSLFVPDYSVSISPEILHRLELRQLEEAQVFVVVNKVDDALTGNLQGPLIVNTINRKGEQVVLPSDKWGTRHVLVKTSKS